MSYEKGGCIHQVKHFYFFGNSSNIQSPSLVERNAGFQIGICDLTLSGSFFFFSLFLSLPFHPFFYQVMLSTLALGTFLTTLLASTVSGQQACNGYSQLCSVPYHQISTIVTHNSYGYAANPAANQACSVSTQLDDGVRGLKLSAVLPANVSDTDPANNIHLCHTSCTILDAGPAKDTLSEVGSWLKSNPNEVVTIMWNSPNNKAFKPSDFTAMYQAAGLLDYTYTQPVDNLTWPTLQEMISSGKRLVTFTDLGADQSQVPW
jgi:hypothetical protein